MATTTRTVAVGLFHDPEDARDAIGALKDAGFAGDDIGLLMHDRDEARAMAEETGTHAGEGAATGLVAGGILGGLGGWLVGIGALAIPGVGPFIAAGAFGAALTGAAVGAGVGAIAGALIGMGIPREEADYYEQEVRGGRTLVTVRAGGRMSEADAILHEHGAYDVEHRDGAATASGAMAGTAAGTAYAGTTGSGYAGTWDTVSPYYRDRWQQRYGTTGDRWEEYEPAYRYAWEYRQRPEYADRSFASAGPDLRRDWELRRGELPWDRVKDVMRDVWDQRATDVGETATRRGEQTVRLREEELAAQKTPVQTGSVELRKEVHTEKKTMDVPVTREEVVVERRPVDRRPADRADFAEEGGEIRVPVREEQVTVQKRPVVREEVTVGKRTVQDTQRVSADLRHEEAVIDREGNVDVRGWDENRPRYQQRFQQRYGSSGGRWEDAEPAYRYGYGYRSDPRYRGRSFAEAEPELRRDWEGRFSGRPWDRSRDYVRDAWEENAA